VVRWLFNAVRIGPKGDELLGDGDGDKYLGGWLDEGIARRFVRSNV